MQIKAKCAFESGRQISKHTFSVCKLQPPYVKLHVSLCGFKNIYVYF